MPAAGVTSLKYDTNAAAQMNGYTRQMQVFTTVHISSVIHESAHAQDLGLNYSRFSNTDAWTQVKAQCCFWLPVQEPYLSICA